MPNGITSARLLAAGALAVLLLALGWAVANGLDEDDAASQAPPTRETVATTTRPKPAKPPAARSRFVKLTAAGAFDPEGDGHERDEEAPLAVDGNRSTFWRTERYSRFFKTGVGLVLDAGRGVRVRQVVVDSATPGVRFVKTAQGFGDNGVIRSICADTYGGALTNIIEAAPKLVASYT